MGLKFSQIGATASVVAARILNLFFVYHFARSVLPLSLTRTSTCMKALSNPLFLNKSSIKTLIDQKLYPQALKISLSVLNPNLTDQIYSLFIKSGNFLEPFLSTPLISHFSKLGDFSRAILFLLDTKNPDTVSFNALISGYARIRQPGPVFELFDRLRQVGLRPDVFSLSSLVKACESLDENEIAHGVCLRVGFGSGAFVVSGLIENYARSADIGSAEKCFRECLSVDNVVYTAMVCGYVWNGEFGKSKEVIMEMRSLGLELNEFSLTSVTGALVDVREGKQIHGFAFKMGYMNGGSLHFNNAVMSMYCRCGIRFDAVKVFDEICDPDIVSWTERIAAAYDDVEALEMFKIVHSRGFEMNEYTMINVLTVIAAWRMLNPGKQIQAMCQKKGFLQVVSVGNALILIYGKCGQMNDSRKIFEDMSFWDSVSWNSLIDGYSENGLVCDALQLFCQMRDSSLHPNEFTLASILEAVSNLNSVKWAMQIHSYMTRVGFMLDDSMVSCLITAYGRCSGFHEAKRLLSEIDKISVVHFNAMAAGLLQVGCHDDALDLFQTTWNSFLEADSTTFSIVLKASAALTNLECGRTIHSLVLKAGFDMDSFVESAIIDIYCKCGSLSEAQKAFKNTNRENLAAWNAMITGYAQHGCYNDVFDLFSKMSDFGTDPDEITYLGVLASCCHAGLVEQAQVYLTSMSEVHGLMPRLEHYACMVDLLGRVGLTEYAKRTIDSMPLKPDAHIWQILLSACNIHGNVDLGRFAANNLLELQPTNETAYVLLSNLYASAGMWSAAGKLRKQMKEKVICKEPGSSWIQVTGSTHYFFADDTSHPESRDLFMELERLYGQMLALPDFEQDGSFFMDSL